MRHEERLYWERANADPTMLELIRALQAFLDGMDASLPRVRKAFATEIGQAKRAIDRANEND